jgi:hypothetical protein
MMCLEIPLYAKNSAYTVQKKISAYKICLKSNGVDFDQVYTKKMNINKLH